jgi:hypothetical protein
MDVLCGMIRRTLLLLLVGGSLLLSGCLPMYILDKNEREEMQELNLKREQAGLKPVTWEEYHNHGMHP